MVEDEVINSPFASPEEATRVKRELRRAQSRTQREKATAIQRAVDPVAWRKAIVLALAGAAETDIARALGLEIGSDTSLAIMRIVAKRLRREGLEASAHSSVGIEG